LWRLRWNCSMWKEMSPGKSPYFKITLNNKNHRFTDSRNIQGGRVVRFTLCMILYCHITFHVRSCNIQAMSITPLDYLTFRVTRRADIFFPPFFLLAKREAHTGMRRQRRITRLASSRSGGREKRSFTFMKLSSGWFDYALRTCGSRFDLHWLEWPALPITIVFLWWRCRSKMVANPQYSVSAHVNLFSRWFYEGVFC